MSHVNSAASGHGWQIRGKTGKKIGYVVSLESIVGKTSNVISRGSSLVTRAVIVWKYRGYYGEHT